MGQCTNHSARRAAGLGWIPALLILVLAACCAGAGFYFLHGKTIATTPVQRGTLVRAFYATGTVRPDQEYLIKSRAQGALVKFEAREGTVIQRGQLLATVDDKQLQFEVARLKAELEEARKKAAEDAPERLAIRAKINEARQQLEISERELKRLTAMFDKGAASLPDVDATRRVHVQYANMLAEMESQELLWRITSQKNLQVAEANLRKAEANLADSSVYSPVDGIVLAKYVEPMQVVGINETLLLVADPRELLMKAAVDEEDITGTSIGQVVHMQLYAYADQVFQGKVKEILPNADRTNKTYEVKVTFDQPPAGLKTGMTAELNFIQETKENVLMVPTSAILSGNVWKITDKGPEALPVKLGIRNLEKVEILEGLKEGDLIALDAKQVAAVKLPQQKQPVVPTRKGDQ